MARRFIRGVGGVFGFGFGEWVCTLWERWEWEERLAKNKEWGREAVISLNKICF
jgi:hypothetical protein